MVRIDSNGEFWHIVIGAAVGAVIGGAVNLGTQLILNRGNFSNVNWRSVGASAVAGAVTGAFASATGGLSLFGSVAAGALLGGISYGTYNLVNGTPATFEGYADSMAFGGTISGLTNGYMSQSDSYLGTQANNVVAEETPEQKYTRFAEENTHNEDNPTTALGKYIKDSDESYDAVAKSKGYTYFKMDQTEWDAVSNEIGEKNMWEINKRFLDQQVDTSRGFVLTSDPSEATGYFKMEIDYLEKQHGIKFYSQPGGDGYWHDY